MTLLVITDLSNGKVDMDHIAAVANSTSPTATDRLGNVKKTISGIVAAGSMALSVEVAGTIAAGLAATTTGRYFSVPSPDSAESLILYLNNAGTAVERKRYSSASALEFVVRVAPKGGVLGMADGDGLVAWYTADDGTLVAHTVSAQQLTGNSVGTAVGGLVSKKVPGFVISHIDDDGLSAGGLKEDGTLAFSAMEAKTLNGVSVASIIAGGGASAAAVAVPLGSFTAEVNGFSSYGQSRSVGEDAQPSISTAQRFDNLRFSGGVRTQDAGGTVAANHGSLVPLTEIDTGTLGETPITGATDFVKELVLLENGLSFAQQSYQLLATAPGAGATTLANLSIGSTSFVRLQADIQHGFALAQMANKTYKFRAFTWSQGEADYLANTPAATYEAALIKLRSDVDAYAKSITGQTEDVICIMDQLIDHAARGYANNPYLAMVQRKVAREQLHFYLATTLGHIDSVGVHHSPQQSKWLGAYFGQVYKRVVIDQQDWQPVEPVAQYRQGAVAMVRFNVPLGKLVFDASAVAMQANYGFTLVDAAGVALTISSVAIVEKDMVKVVASAAIPAGARLRYGWSSTALGNLRDTAGDTRVFDGGGLNKAMHNWCVMFEEILA